MPELKAVCLLDVCDMFAIDQVFEECPRQDEGSGKTNLCDVPIHAMLGCLLSVFLDTSNSAERGLTFIDKRINITCRQLLGARKSAPDEALNACLECCSRHDSTLLFFELRFGSDCLIDN